jgi:transcriptional regulator of met regulon
MEFKKRKYILGDLDFRSKKTLEEKRIRVSIPIKIFPIIEPVRNETKVKVNKGKNEKKI